MSMVRVDLAAAEVAKGLAFTCAFCERYWEKKVHRTEFKAPSDGKKCTGNDCGSPFAGDAFSEYKGPFGEEALRKYCFVCGAESIYGIRVRDLLRVIGVCSKHMGWFKFLKDPKSARGPKKGELDLIEMVK